MPNIAFLGAGNMASAMVDGLLAKDPAARGSLACLGGPRGSAARLAARTLIREARSADELCAGADVLVVAFKPQHLVSADPRLAALTRGLLVVSVLAGKPLGALSRTFPQARNIVRCMPNTPSRIGAGITAWCALQPLSEADNRLLESLLAPLGKTLQVPESQMDAVTGLSGSGPAYVFEFAAALRDAGVAAGLDPASAEQLAVETLLGSARLLAVRGEPPEKLRDEVTSPNGTTLAGLRRLSAAGFRQSLTEAVLAAQARASEIAREEPPRP